MTDQQICAFCDDFANTYEHIFGKWMKYYVKTDSNKTMHRTSHIDHSGSHAKLSVGWRPKFQRNGPPHKLKIQIVCRRCNGGWMGSLQDSAKPHLIPFIKGAWPFMSDERMLKIARWATMVTMCLEFGHPETIAATKEERCYLRDKLQPPENWQVYLAHYGGARDSCGSWHRSWRVAEADDVQCDFGDVQTTTFNVGRSFFHVLSGPLWVLPEPTNFRRNFGYACYLADTNRASDADRLFYERRH